MGCLSMNTQSTHVINMLKKLKLAVRDVFYILYCVIES